MPLIEGFGDEVVCLLAFLLSLVLVASAWVSTRVVDGGTLVSVVLLDRERFTGLLQRVRERVTTRAQAPLSTSISSTTSVQPSVSSQEVESNQIVTTAAEQRLHVTASDSSRWDGDESVIRSNDEPVIRSNGMSEAGTVTEPSQSSTNFTAITPAATSAATAPATAAPATAPATAAATAPATSPATAPATAAASVSPVANSLLQDSYVELKSEVRIGIAVPESVVSPENILSSRTSRQTINSSGSPAASTVEQAGSEAASNLSNSTPVEGHIRIRLQYVDGRQRMVYSHPDSTVGVFKRMEFSEQLADGRSVRFVINGQELRDESMTLRACSVSDGSVIHCLVSQLSTPSQSPPTENQRAGSGHWDLGVLMFPLFGCVLCALWYARIMYRGFFNAASTFSLIAVSFLYIVGLVASLRNNASPGHVHVE